MYLLFVEFTRSSRTNRFILFIYFLILFFAFVDCEYGRRPRWFACQKNLFDSIPPYRARNEFTHFESKESVRFSTHLSFVFRFEKKKKRKKKRLEIWIENNGRCSGASGSSYRCCRSALLSGGHQRCLSLITSVGSQTHNNTHLRRNKKKKNCRDFSLISFGLCYWDFHLRLSAGANFVTFHDAARE